MLKISKITEESEHSEKEGVEAVLRQQKLIPNKGSDW